MAENLSAFFVAGINLVRHVRPCVLSSAHRISGNLVLQDTTERMFVHSNKTYADIKRGIYLVRGENLSILGEIVSRD